MATINLGRVKPVFRGAYAGGTAYVVDDIVTYSNETYICILASTGNLPTDTTYFTKLAAKGTDGTDVGTTLTTQGDILYRDGSGLQRLGAGTAGQVLQTGGAGANPSWTTMSSDVVRLGTIDRSSATSINLDYFSSTYNYYQILVRAEQETYQDSIRLRVRQGGTTQTGSSYIYTYGGSQVNSGSTGNTQNGGSYSGTDHISIGVWSTENTNASQDFKIWVYYPTVYATQNPYIQWERWGASNGGEKQHTQGFGYYNNSTSLTGLNLYSSASNSFTWSAVVYGYKHN